MSDGDFLDAPPGPALRDPSYQDLCGFFATFEEGKGWQPRLGDWVVVPPGSDPRLVVAYDQQRELLTVMDAKGTVAAETPRASCIWLPTLDQLRILLRRQFGTTGFFSSTFNDSTYWYTGQMLGMTVTNMQPLAEGKSPEEAAVKALLMRHTW